MALTLADRRGQKPALGPLKLNAGNPLANGLQFALVLHDYGNFAPWESMGKAVMDLNGGAAWGSGTGPLMNLPSASSSYLAATNTPPDAPYLGALTIMYRGKINSGSAYRAFIGKCTTNGGHVNPFDFRTDNSATPKLAFVRANGAGYHEYDSSLSAVTLNKVQTYAVTTPSSEIATTPAMYVDAAAIAVVDGGGATSGPVTGGAANIQVGRRPDGVVQMDGTCEYVYIWSRALSATEIAQITAEPYSIWMPRHNARRWLVVGAATKLPPGLGPAVGMTQPFITDMSLMR